MPRTDELVDGVSAAGRAMATTVTVRALPGGHDPKAARRAVVAALRTFSVVERTCTRFDPQSPLMRANADPRRWCDVPRPCFDALVEAHRAYLSTRGRFDPRILDDLVALGYDRTLPFAGGPVDVEPAISRRSRTVLGRWRPRFRSGPRPSVLLGDRPVDLGGIGKGLAVRWAAARLAPASRSFLVEAGGDCFGGGTAPEGHPWHVGIEDPRGGDEPIAVLDIRDRACATSSTRVRRWRSAGHARHHLIDPRTGLPGGKGLVAVTVVGTDPAMAEVWSKVLFLAGPDGAPRQAAAKGLAALWVDDAGRVGTSRALDRHLCWGPR